MGHKHFCRECGKRETLLPGCRPTGRCKTCVAIIRRTGKEVALGMLHLVARDAWDAPCWEQMFFYSRELYMKEEPGKWRSKWRPKSIPDECE